MIKLNIEPYCDECPRFRPEVKTETMWVGNEPHRHTIVTCDNRLVCKGIERHLTKHRESDNRCICCNTVIPEGRQVCPVCEVIQRED